MEMSRSIQKPQRISELEVSIFDETKKLSACYHNKLNQTDTIFYKLCIILFKRDSQPQDKFVV